MGQEDDDVMVISRVEDVATWIYFALGACSQAAFVKSGDEERDKRSRWASITVGQLMPALQAMVRVSIAHREEFREHLGDAILLRRMP